MQTSELFENYISSILIFGLVGLVILWIAKANGFFVLPQSAPRKQHLRLSSVFIVFGTYVLMTMLIAPLLMHLIRNIHAALHPMEFPIQGSGGWAQIIILFAIFLLITLFVKAQYPELFKKIWKDRSIPDPAPLHTDFLMGILTWFIAFPIVAALGQFFDLLVDLIFGFTSYEQVAIRYLKSTLSSPELLTMALFIILIAAPIIEEFLFRGCLQTYFKRYFSKPKAIVCSSTCFALFHFAISQGVGNISLMLSLFSFALFLGFIYERQASLIASIGLHMTFNAATTLRILFFSEG